MNVSLFFVLVFIVAGMVASVMLRKLTIPAAFSGGIIATLLYAAFGWIGILLMSVFFILGTVATAWKRSKKESTGAAENNYEQRNAGQVWANAGTAAICSALSLLWPQHNTLFSVMMAASFSSATADTLSSELGTVYGRRFYNIVSGKRDKKGLDGVISFEGTAIGVCGSAIISMIHAVPFDGIFFWIVLIAGTVGNLSDSLLGATLERNGRLSNDAVNFLNTLIAAIAGGGIFLLQR
jgi:uncharacterized protein (TIGR00297 family)